MKTTPVERANWRKEAEKRLMTRDRQKCGVCGSIRSPRTGILTHHVIEGMQYGSMDCSVLVFMPEEVLKLLDDAEGKAEC
jgi:hypothetical protein